MEVRINKDDGTIVAAVVGRIEGQGDAESLRIALYAETVKPGATALIVDLKELGYINSTGLRTLAFMLNRTREAKMRFIMCGLNDSLREVLALSGFDQIIDTAETLEEAKWMLAA